ncbi:aminoglycoside phosphotransferase family protein [Streptomyces pathocidini]|uniref:Aminoglycoside phosphotransferase family protein n=1 Tax=Streptomyces pathocidini TaxID=1650571 RepID=A0ABW7ULK4_9ACTN|nr:aminoglycoside phosphotransferase family protein [Streptomyces pathocidini]
MDSAARPDAGGPFEPPRRLVRALAETHGDAGGEWLRALPELVRDTVSRWELEPERVLTPGGRSSLVVLVRRADGTPAALKLLAPGARGAHEHAALARWDGWGAVRMLAAAEGALLLERLRHEVSLSSLPEAKAQLEAADTVRKLWVDPGEDHPFESVAERSRRAAEALRAARTQPWAEAVAPLIDEALDTREELTASAAERAVLLHGRFRQGKVLSAERVPWLTVGPRPVVGERAYDLARLVRDRLEDLVASPGGAAAARRRVTKLADSLEVDRDRVRGWTRFRATCAGVRALGAGRRQEGELLLEFATWP